MKNKEIERKFIINKKDLMDLTNLDYIEINQGYIQNIGSSYTYRLRQSLYMSNGICVKTKYFQTIKSVASKIRDEYEIEITAEQFSELWKLCKNISIHKHRYNIHKENSKIIFELDILKNNLEGLCVVEVEFENEFDCDNFEIPSWFGAEITSAPEYSNYELATKGLPSNN